LELTNHVVSNLDFRESSPSRSGEHAPGYGLRWRRHCSSGIRATRTLRIYALDFSLKGRISPRGSLVPIDEDVSGAVFRTGKLWCGSNPGGEATRMKDTAQAEVGTVCVLPLVSRGHVLGTFGVVKYQDNAFLAISSFCPRSEIRLPLLWRMHLPLAKFES